MPASEDSGARHLFAGGKIMKLAPAFLAVILTLVSCETTQLRILHNKEIRAELANYSDILDTRRTKICLYGTKYHIFNSAAPEIFLSLYLKPGNDNRETVIAVRDDLIAFLGNNHWETRGRKGYPKVITIDFILKESGENIIFYKLFLNDTLWGEKWHDDIFENILEGRTIEKLDALLGKYSDSPDIGQFRAYYAPYFIRVQLIVPDGYNRGTIITIGDDLVDFFENNWQELEEEYGEVNYIFIEFHRVENGELETVYYMQASAFDAQWKRGWLDNISEL
jgi:hypothetical protein